MVTLWHYTTDFSRFCRHHARLINQLQCSACQNRPEWVLAAGEVVKDGLDPDLAARLRAEGPEVIRGYVGGRDLLQQRRERYLIDFTGLSEEETRSANPAAFQRVLDYVKPERDQNRRESIRTLWWRFGWEPPVLRKALSGLARYVQTT